MLEIKGLKVKLEEEDKQILKGVDLTVEAGIGACDHGPQRFGQVDAQLCPVGPRRLRGDRWQCATLDDARTCSN